MPSQYHVFELGQNNQPVILVFGGWKTHPWLYWLPARILAANGYHVIVYTYANHVFSPDPQATLTSLTVIRDSALKRISQLKAAGHHDFAVMGFSLGTIIALMVANNAPNVTRVILNLVGARPAEAVWTWDTVHPRFKHRLLDQNLTLQSLSQIWAPLAPVNNLNRLTSAQFLVYLTKPDQLIPFDQGLAFVDHLKQAGYPYRLIISRRPGHTLAEAYNLFNTKVYLNFLKHGLTRKLI